MSTIRKSGAEIRRGRISKAKVRGATEKRIRAWKAEEGYGDYQLVNVRAVPAVNVRKIRERLRLSQEEFAARYRLSLRSLQEWEQGRKQPSEAARVLLYAIARAPKALERALRAS